MIIKSQSAGNQINRTSETLCLRSIEYVAGVIDGDGNFDIRVQNGIRKLKAIRIKLSIRDIRILTKVKTILQCGRFRYTKSSFVTWIVSTKSEMLQIIKLLNGHIRLKRLNFLDACRYFEIEPKPVSFKIPRASTYLHGLIDTDGTVVYNYRSNRIEMHLELKKTEYSDLLDISETIPNVTVRKNSLIKRNQTRNKIYYCIRYSIDTVSNMVHLYDYIMGYRLFSDFKFYRISKIPAFIKVRRYKNEPIGSLEHQIYSKWVIDFISYLNPKYIKMPYFHQLTR